MGFNALYAIGDFELRMDESPQLTQPLKIQKVEWIGEIAGVWFINVRTQFGWMNFEDVTVREVDKRETGFDGSVFKFEQYRVSVSSTYKGNSMVTEGTPENSSAGIYITSHEDSGAPRPTISQMLAGPLNVSLDPAYRFYLGGGNGDDRFVAGPSGSYVDALGGADHVFGGDAKDEIYAGSGKDEVDGAGGDDEIHGQDDDDVLRGGDGQDLLSGEHGNDELYGGDKKDKLFGGIGDDILEGGPGNDELSGGDGKDTIRGGPGDDTIWTDAGGDTMIFGGAGDDTIWGGKEGERMFGGADDDFIFGYEGDDVILGGGGSDILVGDLHKDKISGGKGNDFLYAGRETQVVDTFEIVGGNVLKGGPGKDWLHSINFTLLGDKLTGGADRDTFLIGNRDIVMDVERGETVSYFHDSNFQHAVIDTIRGGVSIDFVTGSTWETLEKNSGFRLKGGVELTEVSVSVTGATTQGTGALIELLDTEAATPAAKIELGRSLMEVGNQLIKVVEKKAYEEIREKTIETLVTKAVEAVGNTVPGAGKIITKPGAKAMGSVMGELSSVAIDHATGKFDDETDRTIALEYANAAAKGLLPLVFGAGPAVLIGTGIVVTNHLIDAYVDAYAQRAAAEADALLREDLRANRGGDDWADMAPADDWLLS